MSIFFQILSINFSLYMSESYVIRHFALSVQKAVSMSETHEPSLTKILGPELAVFRPTNLLPGLQYDYNFLSTSLQKYIYLYESLNTSTHFFMSTSKKPVITVAPQCLNTVLSKCVRMTTNTIRMSVAQVHPICQSLSIGTYSTQTRFFSAVPLYRNIYVGRLQFSPC